MAWYDSGNLWSVARLALLIGGGIGALALGQLPIGAALLGAAAGNAAPAVFGLLQNGSRGNVASLKAPAPTLPPGSSS